MPQAVSKKGLLQRVGILPKWSDCTWDQFTNDAAAKKRCLTYVEKHSDLKKEGLGLYIHGGNGVGKTTVAMLILMDIFFAKKHSVRAVTLGTLINLQTLGWYDKESREEFTSIYQKPDFLLIEGVGKEHKAGQNDLGATTLDTVLYYRAQAKKPTIITTVYPPDKIISVYNNDIASLLNEICLVLPIKGDDKRNEIHAAKSKKYGFR